jgi:hypothetical protein
MNKETTTTTQKDVTCIKQACDILEKEYIIIKENLKLSCKWVSYIGSNTILQKKFNYMKYHIL